MLVDRPGPTQPTGDSGEPEWGGCLVARDSSKLIVLLSHGSKFSSPHACVSSNDVKGLDLGFPPHAEAGYVCKGTAESLGMVGGCLLSPRPCSLLRLAWGKCVIPECTSGLGQRALSQNPTGVYGEEDRGACGTWQDNRRRPQTSLKVGHFGNADTRGSQAPTCSTAWERYERLHL